MKLVLWRMGALLAFMSGRGSAAILVNWARHHQLRGTYALPLLLDSPADAAVWPGGGQ